MEAECEFVRANVQRKMDWYNQLFLLGEGGKTWAHHLPPPPTASPPILYFFASFAILFTTQEYTHQSPGGASWMRAEIQCAHYAVKKHCFSPQFSLTCFVLFKCLHGTARGLEDRCMVQEYRLSTILLFPWMKVMTPFWMLFKSLLRINALMKQRAQHPCSFVKMILDKLNE